MPDLPWLAGAVLAAVLVRIMWVAYVNVDPNDGRLDDSYFYHNTGNLLANTGSYLDAWGRGLTADFPPAYAAALAVLYKFFGWHLLLAKGFNIAAAAVTVVAAYLIGGRIFNRRVAFLGALVLALFPGQIYYSNLVLPETMFAMALMLVLLLTLAWTVQRSEAHWWQVLLIGILVGVSAMVRTEGVFLMLVLVGVWAATVRPWSKIVQYTLLLTVGVIVAVTPWTVRNAIQLDAFMPLRPYAARGIAKSLDPNFDRRVDKTGEQRSLAGAIRYDLMHPWEVPPYVGREIKALYANDSAGIVVTAHLPGEKRNVRGLPLGWGTEDFEPPLNQEQVTRWSGLADRYFFAAGAAALMAAAICLLQRNRASFVLLFTVLAWTLIFGFIQPVSRYHFPLSPIIAILAGAFIVFVWDGAQMALSRLFSRRPVAYE